MQKGSLNLEIHILFASWFYVCWRFVWLRFFSFHISLSQYILRLFLFFGFPFTTYMEQLNLFHNSGKPAKIVFLISFQLSKTYIFIFWTEFSSTNLNCVSRLKSSSSCLLLLCPGLKHWRSILWKFLRDHLVVHVVDSLEADWAQRSKCK